VLLCAIAALLAAVGVAVESSPAAAATAYRYVYPVVGHSGYSRKHHDYPASDIIARCGLPVVAAVDGVVLELSRVDLFNQGIRIGSTRGGKFVSILGEDGVRYYNSHLSGVKGRIRPGVRVRAGQKIGEVGRTGRAGACHLHFGISPPCARTGDWWVRRGTIWPAPYLDSWRKQDPTKHLSPRSEVAAYSKKSGCPPKP
jgi:murein DD-endopeptidase MepM/ murein hydrolase activator NlpD